MKNSDKRIDFIAGYLAAYKNKIKLKNKLGLYDCAKLFELFALEISKLYFCQTFHNCNDENPQFPYIDLLSENGEIFVQVSVSFFDYRKAIKEDAELTNAFVSVLKVLIDLRYEQAAVFLDEFLIH